MRTKAAMAFRLVLIGCIVSTLVQGVEGGVIRQESDEKYEARAQSEIRKSLGRLNEVLATKDLNVVMSIYDTTDDIVVVGSDSGEVFVGRERVRAFMKIIVSMPFVFSFDMDQVFINNSRDIAWVFVDGKMVHTRSSGKVSKIPYRITAVMVKRGDEWKWKVFSGSIPRGE
jgi:ketosteroid isomerase-like protein